MTERRSLEFGKGADGAAIWAEFRSGLLTKLASALPTSALNPAPPLEETAI